MKLLILLSLAAICTVLVFGLNNYNDIAIHLRNQIRNVLANITMLRGTLTKKWNEIPKTNFGFSSWSSIAGVQASLEGKAKKNGVKVCQNKFNDGFQLLLSKAQLIAKKELTYTSYMLTGIQKRMISVESKVTGKKNVDKEIAECQKSVKCKMTGDYAKIVELDEKLIASNFTTMIAPNILEIILLRYVESLAPVIKDNIVTPVYICLQAL